MELIQELRQQTQRDHQALEKDLVRKIKSVQSPEEYIDLLYLMHGFYAAMERQLDGFLSDVAGLDFGLRRKAEWILNDIDHFGNIGSSPSCERLPEITSFSSALGAMYVLEGSTLGGHVIAKILKQQLGTDSDDGLSFFRSYGSETAVMWDRFRRYLDRPYTDVERSQIIRGAKDTFVCFRNWIQQYELERAS